MRKEADRHKINIVLATADQPERCTSEAVRYSRRVAWRNLVAKQRVPTESTSLGRAYLAVISGTWRDELLEYFN